MALPKRVSDRIQSSLKVFFPVLAAQKDRDVSEADRGSRRRPRVACLLARSVHPQQLH